MQSNKTGVDAPMRGRSRLDLLRVQIVTGILISAVLPYFIRVVTLDPTESIDVLNKTLLVVILATVGGIWLIRNLNTYPGVEKTSSILPSFTISYGVALTILLLVRVEYNRVTLFSGFILSFIWFYALRIWVGRWSSFKIAVTPFSGGYEYPDFPGINWIPFDNPEQFPAAADAVTVDLRQDIPDNWERALADVALSGVPVLHIKHLMESLTGRVELEHLSEDNFGSLSPVSPYATAKYSLDPIVAACGLVILAPVLVLCSLAIRLDSPGPALFRQVRIGYQGRPFTVYKLRTMKSGQINDDCARSAAITMDEDTRITRMGRFLRKSRLDELPQLFNVLRGEMSLIGPRPEAEILGQWYEAEIPFYRYRHIVRPGITGWAQVNQGHVAEMDEVKRKLYYDFYYIKNFSPWIDGLIIARTIRTMITGFGAR